VTGWRKIAQMVRPQGADPSRHRVSDEATHRGQSHRLLLACVTGLIASTWVNPLLTIGWLCLVIVHEMISLPLVMRHGVRAHAKTSPQIARAWGVGVTITGASIYAMGWAPAYFTGADGTGYFAGVWVACAIIHALVYSHNDRVLFAAHVAPALTLALIGPFYLYGLTLLPFVLLLASARLVVTTFFAFRDRLALLASAKLSRKQRQAAEEASAAKSKFLATMSHELRTPLNAVIGYAEILEEDLADEGMKHSASDAQRIHRAARQLLGLINEVLDLSKIEAGRMEVAPRRTDLRALIADAVETTAHIAAANGNSVSVTIDASVGPVTVDDLKVRQCLLNLVSNACKFTKHGEIGVEARIAPGANGDVLCIKVRDTGMGIAPEQAARLFQPFVQVDSSLTRDQGGTGLGLVITRKIAQLLGGDVALESAAGIGSCFTLTVAIERCPEQSQSSDVDGAPLVLIIEDEPAARDLYLRALSRMPLNVICAATAAEGAALARARQPDLIVLDIHLPDAKGWDVMAAWRHDVAAPVLVISIDDDRARALALGASEVFVKPIDRDRFTAAVMRLARAPDAPTPALTFSDDQRAAG